MADVDNTIQNQEDFEAQKARLDSYLAEQFNQHFDKRKQELQQVSQTPQKTQQQDIQDQFKQAINPLIEPSLNEARFTAADAQDYVKFYTNNPEAMVHQEKIEKIFTTLKEAGRATIRADVLKYSYGDDFVKDPDKFIEGYNERKKKQLERVESASDFGAGSLSKVKDHPVYNQENFSKLTVEEMEKALDGVTF